jgi:uncharacterized protein DUF4112
MLMCGIVQASEDRELAHVRAFARVMDRYGLDPILGFVLPEIGDLIGALLGLYIVAYAVRRKMSKAVIARMLLNLGLDALIGAVPVIGDIADFAFKANEKNLKLVESRQAGAPARTSDWLVLILAIAGFFSIFALVIYGIVRLFEAVF